jgi:hypothetical protein
MASFLPVFDLLAVEGLQPHCDRLRRAAGA